LIKDYKVKAFVAKQGAEHNSTAHKQQVACTLETRPYNMCGVYV